MSGEDHVPVIADLTPNEFAELERLAAHVGVSPDAFATRLIRETLPYLRVRRQDLERATGGTDAQ